MPVPHTSAAEMQVERRLQQPHTRAIRSLRIIRQSDYIYTAYQAAMTEQKLLRRLGLRQATAINMIDMVGIGPFITLPMVIGLMNGPWFLYAWIAGAVLSVVDAMVWSELGAAFPRAGGSYNFLREAYGQDKAGRLMSFLFVWQTMIQAPLVIASAAIGFAAYFQYLVPLTLVGSKLVSGGVVLLIVLLLYRRIDAIGRISVLLWVGVIIALVWIIAAGIGHGSFLQPVREINQGLELSTGFAAALGYACIKSVYSYLGYYNVCHLGAEIVDPEKNIPRSMYISIAGIAVLYLLMNISVVSIIPWQEARHEEAVLSVFMQRLMGDTAAQVLTVLILWVAFASVFSATLGYSRIPYAAAQDGNFFRVFARLHPTKHFPHISLLFLGGVALVFSLLFRLSHVISAILAMRILVQFVGQAWGLVLLRRRRGSAVLPYRMPLYPIPVVLAILLWLALFAATGPVMMAAGTSVIALGCLVYLVKARLRREWPFG